MRMGKSLLCIILELLYLILRENFQAHRNNCVTFIQINVFHEILFVCVKTERIPILLSLLTA